MKKVLAFVGGVLLLVNTAFAYDAELARDVGMKCYRRMISSFQGMTFWSSFL
jgi:hypothetical protein